MLTDLLSAMDISAAQIILSAFLALCSFIVSTVVGVGATLLLVPVLIFFMPPATAVAIAAPVMLMNNIVKSAVFRKHVKWRTVILTGVTAWPLAAISATYTGAVGDSFLRCAIGILILISFVIELAFKKQIEVQDKGLLLSGFVIGGASGFCGAAGVPVAFVYRNHGLVKEKFVGTIAVLAIGLQSVKIPVYVSGGLLLTHQLPLIFLLMMMSLCGIFIGKQILKRLSPALFRRILDVLLLGLALWLIYPSI
jgi:uncharacterized protein